MNSLQVRKINDIAKSYSTVQFRTKMGLEKKLFTASLLSALTDVDSKGNCM